MMTTIIQSIRSVGIKGKRRRNQWWSPAAREAISEINAILRCCDAGRAARADRL
jgi:hypothetical protein